MHGRPRLTLEPANVFLLLLHLDVVGDHVGELGVNASLLEITLHESLQVLIEVLEGWAGVQALAGPVLLGSLSVGQIGLGEVGDLLDLEQTVLSDSLDQKGAGAGLLDGDVHASGEAGLQVAVQVIQLAIGGSDAVLGVLGHVTGAALVGRLVTGLEIHLVEGGIVKVLLLGQVLKVGNGESEADPERNGG